MKFKKLIIAALATLGLTSIALTSSQPVAAALSKNKVIKIAKKDLSKVTSAKANINLKLKYNKNTANFQTTGIFGGNPMVIHLISSSNSQADNGKTTNNNVNQWIDSAQNQSYTLQDNAWEPKALTQTEQQQFAQIKNIPKKLGSNANFTKQLTKQAKVKHTGSTYTLTANITNQKIAKQLITSFAKGLNLNDKQLAKSLKVQKVNVKMIIKQQKLTSCQLQAKATYNKSLALNLKADLTKLGAYNQLTIPSNIINAGNN
ncbi:hypothetical protein [Lactobacillus sp. ESL0681]|uniref:hypothetical protein n=1 Tax=Lactobacillus sp. ESL0681 TaxID=2983211 RepID=UPI0023F6951B|nr:hypothetical protein [Lactobacillus sp. ESL0681]WEV39642.1 hypothetical protein OZX59_05345 [Lactobacillus sp. ESL0681]